MCEYWADSSKEYVSYNRIFNLPKNIYDPHCHKLTKKVFFGLNTQFLGLWFVIKSQIMMVQYLYVVLYLFAL